MTFLSPRPTRAVGLQDQTITINGRRSVAVSTTARGTLLRSSGASTAIGLERVTARATGQAALSVNVELRQSGKADSLTAVGLRSSAVDYRDTNDAANVSVTVHASGARATAIALDSSRWDFRGGPDEAVIRADITGCWAQGSQAIALRDSNIALDANGDTSGAPDRITVAATGGHDPLWGLRSGVRGWGGDDVMTFVGQAEDVIINAFGGDDRVILGGMIRSTRAVAPPGGLRFGRIDGSNGFDTLELRYLSGAQFAAQITPFNDGSDAGFTLPGGARFIGWETVRTCDGRTFDVSGVGL